MEITNEEKAKEISQQWWGCGKQQQITAYAAAIEAMEWKEQQLIDKAAEWLRMTMEFFNNGEFNTEKFVNDFKQEMKGE